MNLLDVTRKKSLTIDNDELNYSICDKLDMSHVPDWLIKSNAVVDIKAKHKESMIFKLRRDVK
jgi:hypothetical protein